MLLIRASVAPSLIAGAGLGLFAAEPVAAGATVWRFEPAFDRLLDIADVRAAPAAFRAFFDTYCYESHEFPGRYVLSCDHAKFINHAAAPNIASRGLTSHAVRAIAAGEEITCDYGAALKGWPGFGAPAVPT